MNKDTAEAKPKWRLPHERDREHAGQDGEREGDGCMSRQVETNENEPGGPQTEDAGFAARGPVGAVVTAAHPPSGSTDGNGNGHALAPFAWTEESLPVEVVDLILREATAGADHLRMALRFVRRQWRDILPARPLAIDFASEVAAEGNLRLLGWAPLAGVPLG